MERETLTLGEFLAEVTPDPHENIEEEVMKRDTAEWLKSLKSSLTERQRLVLQMRFDEELNLEEIGIKLGLTKQRIGQIEAAGLKRLRMKIFATEEKTRITQEAFETSIQQKTQAIQDSIVLPQRKYTRPTIIGESAYDEQVVEHIEPVEINTEIEIQRPPTPNETILLEHIFRKTQEKQNTFKLDDYIRFIKNPKTEKNRFPPAFYGRVE